MKTQDEKDFEVTQREAFGKFLIETYSAELIERPSLYGVDIVARINGSLKFFELKTSKKTQTEYNEKGYFGAITMREWLCAARYEEDFYLVFMMRDDTSTDNYKFIPIGYKEIFKYASLEPFATYVNIPSNSLCDDNLFDTSGQCNEWDGKHKSFSKCNKNCRINEHFILKFSNFYCKQNLAEEDMANKRKGQTYVYYIIPTKNVENLLKHGISKGKELNILHSCRYNIVDNFIKTNESRQEKSYAVVKIKLTKSNHIFLSNSNEKIKFLRDIKISPSNIIEMYFIP